MEKQIYYHDTDAGGVVYYGRYLQFMEESRTEFLAERGLTVKDLHQQGFLYAVRDCNIQYKKPARYGDIISCEANLIQLKAAQMIFDQKIFLKEDQSLLVQAKITLVSLTREFKPVVIPDNIRGILNKSITNSA